MGLIEEGSQSANLRMGFNDFVRLFFTPYMAVLSL